LEAVGYLSLTKSFLGAADSDAVQFGEQSFEVRGVLASTRGAEHRCSVVYGGAPAEKIITINSVPAEKLSSVIGTFPVVILAPEHDAVASGGPAERRRFLDLVLSQTSRAYLEDLLEYRRVLRQRNRLLSDARQMRLSLVPALEAWDISLADYGSRLISRRQMFVRDFRPAVAESYRSVVGPGDVAEVRYLPGAVDVADGDPEVIRTAFLDLLVRRREEEIRRGSSLVGPHRDDIALIINGHSAQHFASQGERRTLLVSLKLAEYDYLRERREETPMLLLDDVFSELDAGRCSRVLGHVAGLGQVFITATDTARLDREWKEDRRLRRFIVEQGTCRAA
jgi:DNA replication and repair protein RecF